MVASAKKKENGLPAESMVSVLDLVSEAGRNVEAAAILRAIRERITRLFHDEQGRLPELLLRRQGFGPRPAQTESIVAAEIAIETLACEFDARARELLGLRINVGSHAVPASGDDVLYDEIVDRDGLEGELKVAFNVKQRERT